MPVKKNEEGNQKAKPKKSSTPKRVAKQTPAKEIATESKTTRARKAPAPIKVNQPRVAPQVLAEPSREAARAPVVREVKAVAPVQKEKARLKPREPQVGPKTSKQSGPSTVLTSVVSSEQATATISEDLKSCTPTQDQIAFRAWEIWNSEGCPHGRESEHWFRAEVELQSKRT